MLTQHPHSSSAVRLAVVNPLSPPESSSSPSPPSTPTNSSGSSGASSQARSQQPTPARPRSRTGFTAASSTRQRSVVNRPRALSAAMTFTPSFTASSGSSSRTPQADPGSPPPYTPEPPELDPNSPFLAKRAVSSPHLHSPPQSPGAAHVYPHSHASSRRPSSSTALLSHTLLSHGMHTHTHASGSRHRTTYARMETDEDEGSESAPSGEERVTYMSSGPSIAGTLRERLFGKGKGRANISEQCHSITTAPGVVGAGETETEGEDSVSAFPMFARCFASLGFSRATK